MNIHFSPQNRSLFAPLVLSKLGDVLTINGEDFDFSAVGEGDILPRSAIASDLFARDVTRDGGVLVIHLYLFHGDEASEAMRFPDPTLGATDGPIGVPA